MVPRLLQNTLKSKVRAIYSMIKKILFFILFPFTLYANDCLVYKQIPNVKISKPEYEKNVIQSDEHMEKYHGNVLATLVEDYDIITDIITSGTGYCVVIRAVDGIIGYNDFLVKIDNSHDVDSCEYRAVLNHEDKHIDAYLSVIDDMWADISGSVFNAANSVMPVFVSSRGEIDLAIENMNIKMRAHPELVLMKQKIKAAQEIRNKRVDQNEDNHELKSCFIIS